MGMLSIIKKTNKLACPKEEFRVYVVSEAFRKGWSYGHIDLTDDVEKTKD